MFKFKKYEFDSKTKIASFKYSLNEYNFSEELDFSHINIQKQVEQTLLDKVLFFLHLLLWISYYKLTCEKEISIESWVLNKTQANFFNTLYTKWLWEFFYENKIDFKNLIKFPYENNHSNYSFKKQHNEVKKELECLVPVWWWKDSSVVLSLFEKNNIPFEIFTLWENSIYEEVSKSFWKKPLIVKRRIDPLLIKLNKTWKYFNGHIPISSIIAWVSLFVSVARWYNYIVLANEQSANVWNTTWNWMEINHQYSKSLEFEELIQSFILEQITDITYFSLLRPLTELKITEIFSKNCTKLFDKFSSCNKNFKLFKTKQNIWNNNKWCCTCPKCAFVFIMLSVFLWNKQTSEIFWENLFKNKKLIPLFKDLAWFWDIKPFECVWLKEEVQVWFYKILEKEGINHMPVLEEISKYKLEKDFEKYINSFEKNLIPKQFLKIVSKS